MYGVESQINYQKVVWSAQLSFHFFSLKNARHCNRHCKWSLWNQCAMKMKNNHKNGLQLDYIKLLCVYTRTSLVTLVQFSVSVSAVFISFVHEMPAKCNREKCCKRNDYNFWLISHYFNVLQTIQSVTVCCDARSTHIHTEHTRVCHMRMLSLYAYAPQAHNYNRL